MSILSKFRECNRGGWTTAGKDVQFKVVDLCLYFQCTNGKSDWRHNFMAAEDVYKNSDVEMVGHKGFGELWDSVRHEIEQLDFVEIFGYSEGADLAILAHENFFHRFGYEPRTNVVAPSPMFKNPSPVLRSRFTNLTCYHNANDIVYQAAKILGYKHVGEQVSLSLKGIKREGDWKLWQWLSGHTPEQYYQAFARDGL
jgi:hypothetical protein